MSAAFDILEEERQRLLELEAVYRRQLDKLPKGTLSYKQRWNKRYCYRAYREAGKVRFVYIGPVDSHAVEQTQKQIEERRTIEKQLKDVKRDLAEIDRSLRVRR